MLEISSLVKVYPGPFAALQSIDLKLDNGMFGLLGPNGAGKSTLMQIVAGVLEPTSGEVVLDGVDVVSRPEYVRQRLGYLPQDFGFYPQLTGRAMLTHLLRLKGVRAPCGEKRLVGELLDRVNLGNAANRRIGGYSGGMRQRLGIAQAIAGDPRILVVDEPTAGLDPEERFRLYRILAELAENRIVLISTHIVEDVSILCPQFAIIRRGTLIARSTPADARAALVGVVFQGDVESADMNELSESSTVIQTVMREGKNRVRVLQTDGRAPEGFDLVEASLEDAYLVAVKVGAGFLGRTIGLAEDGSA